MERQLTAVIDEMLEHVPVEQEDLIARLKSIQSSVAFTAPEYLYQRWRQAACELTHFIPELDTDWKRQVAQIFSGKAVTAAEGEERR